MLAPSASCGRNVPKAGNLRRLRGSTSVVVDTRGDRKSQRARILDSCRSEASARPAIRPKNGGFSLAANPPAGEKRSQNTDLCYR